MKNKALLVIMILAVIVVFGRGNSNAATADENYKFYCTQCHGAEGKGDGINVTKDMSVTPRNHANAADMSKLSDADIVNAIKDGGAANSKSPLMPPFGKTLTAEEIKDLLSYLRKMCNCTAAN